MKQNWVNGLYLHDMDMDMDDMPQPLVLSTLTVDGDALTPPMPDPARRHATTPRNAKRSQVLTKSEHTPHVHTGHIHSTHTVLKRLFEHMSHMDSDRGSIPFPPPDAGAT